MKAMILAAGRGERLRPLTDSVPKPLLEIHGRPVIEWTIERLARGGFRDLVINHAHLGHMMVDALGDGGRFGASIRYSCEGEALETAGGIAKALPLLGEGPFAVVNGDIYCDFDYSRLHRRESRLELAHIVLVPNPAHHPGGDFALEQGIVRADGDTTWTFSGIGLYRSKLFEPVTAGTKARLGPLLRQAMATGAISGEIHRGTWEDIGTPERLARLNR